MLKESVYTLKEQCQAEGFEVLDDKIIAHNQTFPLAPPVSIYLKLYRTHPSHETRFQSMKRAYELLWPNRTLTWNYWMERIFREHTNSDTEVFTLAGGAACGKSYSCAAVVALFFLSAPHKNTAIVASTELHSLKNRIYGYILDLLKEADINLEFFITNSPTPSIRVNREDFLHGIYGVAAKKGDEKRTIESIKGRHPKGRLLLVLDEATDMPIGITSVLPNLKQGVERFQAIAIGNSDSWQDLHGAWSYPKKGIESLDPNKDFRWETTQPHGVCLYFNPYDSPAIHETDPVKKEALSKFLMSEAKLLKSETEQGINSDGYWQFTMGFWRSRTIASTIVSEAFLKDYDPTSPAEFSGKFPMHFVAGLDPAFSTGGDKCILRLAVLGHHTNGKMILDFRGSSLLFEIKLFSHTGKSAEIQIADQVIAICTKFNIPLNTLCIDASGAGRGLADVIQLRSGTGYTPTKIFSTNIGKSKREQLDLYITSGHDMWFTGREFISHKQIHGLDPVAYAQLHTRQVIEKGGKKLLEDKRSYKQRMAAVTSLLGRSPDEADAAMLALQSAILHYGFFPGQTKQVEKFDNLDSYKFEMARRAYLEKNSKVQKDFVLQASYKNGLESILNKKLF